jgi:hypothetical protein
MHKVLIRCSTVALAIYYQIHSFTLISVFNVAEEPEDYGLV